MWAVSLSRTSACVLRMADISGEDVQIWLEEQGESNFAISAYCEKLLPMLREEEGRAGGCSPPSPTKCWARSPTWIHRQL
ncbi:MAG: hypothetical protein ACLT5P_07865 [Flavonifractor plautii]